MCLCARVFSRPPVEWHIEEGGNEPSEEISETIGHVEPSSCSTTHVHVAVGLGDLISSGMRPLTVVDTG